MIKLKNIITTKNKNGLIFKIFSFLLLLLFTKTKDINAYDDLSWAKNKFGIHVNSNPEELAQANDLLNNQGGDWGWVTVVIREDELNFNQWQDYFNKCRELHLVPIVRIATQAENRFWQKPSNEITKKIADFLNQLNWPEEQKFVIVYNEPNQGQEWSGQVNPKEYFEILEFATDYFHGLDKNFFILSAGLDLAAPNKNPLFMSAEEFYRQGFLYKPEVFEKIDGLSSHSYPNHGYVGLPTDTGKTSIKGYLWELRYLANLGLKKKLPVFITETGWPHKEGGQKNYYNVEKVAELLTKAYQIWAGDEKVIAITPFILNYPFGEFAKFSWLDINQRPYPHYQATKEIQKISQLPPQKDKIIVKKIKLNSFINFKKENQGKISLLNQGQQIWGEREQFCLFPQVNNQGVVYLSPICLSPELRIKPGEKVTLDFKIDFEEDAEEIKFGWDKTGQIELKKLPKLLISKTIYPYQKRNLFQKILGFLKHLLVKI